MRDSEMLPVQRKLLNLTYSAEVAELADARGSGPRTRKGVGVRVPSSAPIIENKALTAGLPTRCTNFETNPHYSLEFNFPRIRPPVNHRNLSICLKVRSSSPYLSRNALTVATNLSYRGIYLTPPDTTGWGLVKSANGAGPT